MGDHRRSARPGEESASDPASEHSVRLDERSREVLDFEREAWKLTVPKQRAIRERFGFSPSRYHQLLHRIIDRPEAVAYDPMLVRRLRRVRAVRRRSRTASGLGVRV
jgi:Protein of unknown function (DUF3263)